MPFCPGCGARVDESDNFCTECGGQLYKLRHTARGSTPTRVRRIFLLVVLLLCCCGLLFVVGSERGYFDFGHNSDGETTPSEVSQAPTSTPQCKYVWTEVDGTRYPEPGADYEPIVLCDNPEATDVTWPELKDFLREDKTDEMPYIEDVFMCADFAEMLHNNAEAAGIRAAWVGIDFYYDDVGHALNAFNTTDRGLVYIDVGNVDVASCSSDSIATVLEGKQLASELIFPPCAGQDLEPMGKVKEIWITW